MELETVIVTAALVPWFPDGSCPNAVKVWLPFATVVVSKESEYGVVVSCGPVLMPSTWNWTKDTALSGSVAVAVSVIVPETAELFAGAVMVTTGVVVSVGVPPVLAALNAIACINQFAPPELVAVTPWVPAGPAVSFSTKLPLYVAKA